MLMHRATALAGSLWPAWWLPAFGLSLLSVMAKPILDAKWQSLQWNWLAPAPETPGRRAATSGKNWCPTRRARRGSTHSAGLYTLRHKPPYKQTCMAVCNQ